jgi:hypothetical protein
MNQMNPQNGSHWLTGFADWVAKTLAVASIGALFSVLGCALWMLYLCISVGYEALKI